MKIDMNRWKSDAKYRENMKKLSKMIAGEYRKAAENLDKKGK